MVVVVVVWYGLMWKRRGPFGPLRGVTPQLSFQPTGSMSSVQDYKIDNKDMVISKLARQFTLKGVLMQITLTEVDSYARDRIFSEYSNHVQKPAFTSYFGI